MSTPNNKFLTGPFRLAFPEIFKPKAGVEGGKAKYSVTMLFPKDGSSALPGFPVQGGLLNIRKALVSAVKEKWGEDKSKWPASLRNIDFKTYVSPNGRDGWPIRDGDNVEWSGFSGMVFVRANSDFKPGLVDAKVQAVIDPEAVFGGLICQAQINAFAYSNAGNNGVSLGLNHVQILKDDGTVYGGRSKPEDVFAPVADAQSSVGHDEDPFA
jgi:hypothetical protein